MAVAHTTALNLIGKYVSFYINDRNRRLDYEGVISCLILELDGSHQVRIGFDDHYLLSDIQDLKVLGELVLYSQ